MPGSARRDNASELVRYFIEHDPHFLFAISQNPEEYARETPLNAQELLGGLEPDKDENKEELIAPFRWPLMDCPLKDPQRSRVDSTYAGSPNRPR